MPLDTIAFDGRNLVGQLIRHFKGGLYRVLHCTRSADNPSRFLIVYRSEDDGQIWVRSEEAFFAELPGDVPRFSLEAQP